MTETPNLLVPQEATEQLLNAKRPMTREEIYAIVVKVYAAGYSDAQFDRKE
jgi:hypothetical protein